MSRITYTQFDPIARETGRQQALRITRDTTRATLRDAQVGVPYRTGALSASRHSNVEARPGSAVGTVGYAEDYALAVHQGARPHSITPRRSDGVLRFRVGGRVIITKHVNHPGYRGNPWLYRALLRQGLIRDFRVRQVLTGRVT